MNHMIYIYAGLAFILAGGGAWIGYLVGERIGYRAGNNEGFADGLVVGSVPTPLVIHQDDGGVLADAIDRHLARMDDDSPFISGADYCTDCHEYGDHRTGEHAS